MLFAELQTYVRDRLSIGTGDTDKTAQIKVALNQEYARIVGKHNLLVASASLTLTADDPTVPVPTGWLKTIVIYEGTAQWHEISWNEYIGLVTADASSAHTDDGNRVYVQSGSATLRIHPEAEDSGTATIFFAKAPTAMSDDAHTPSEIPSPFHDLLAEQAVARIALSEEEPALAGAAGAIAANLEREMVSFLAQRKGIGHDRLQLLGYPAR